MVIALDVLVHAHMSPPFLQADISWESHLDKFSTFSLLSSTYSFASTSSVCLSGTLKGNRCYLQSFSETWVRMFHFYLSCSGAYGEASFFLGISMLLHAMLPSLLPLGSTYSDIRSLDQLVRDMAQEYPPTNAYAAASPRAEPQSSRDEVNASASDPVKWHTALSSIVPLLRLLPAFKEESGQYILSGPITPSDVAIVNAHAKHVKSFFIFKRGPESSLLDIAPSVYTRLLRCFGEPFLPSLHKLTVNMPAMLYADIWEIELVFSVLLSHSIREVELYGIDDNSENAVLSLLASLPYDTPQLTKLVFTSANNGANQYRLPLTVMKSLITEMTLLEHLEIDDVVSIAEFDILRNIGALPNLVTFVLHNSTLDYCPSSKGSNAVSSATGFLKLDCLKVTASLELISDLLHYVGSLSLKFLALSPVVGAQHDELEASILNAHIVLEVDSAKKPLAKTEDGDDSRSLPVKKNLKKGTKTRGAVNRKQKNKGAGGRKPVQKNNYWSEEANVSSMSRDHPPVQADHSQHISSLWEKALNEVLQYIPMRWRGLESLTICLRDITENNRIFMLPGRYLNPLRLLADLHTLHIERWKILDCHATLLRLAPSMSNLRSLTLPLGIFSEPVDVCVLQTFADRFPELTYLQIALFIPEAALTRNLCASSYTTAHPLSTLCVGFPSAPMTLTEMMEVAGLIDSLFPGLKRIRTISHEEHGGFCTEIEKLVTLVQSARRKERQRINGGTTN
ncbi:hypothetical protein BDQ17DRAFT_638024 [Cyathus striatus]|nr:hypothetical protein BDQ17DRAFT_638024 [Cyathus striatus]